MSRSVVYRESDREWEEAPRRSYTTVKRYQVPETVRSSHHEDEETKDKIVIKRTERREASRDPPRDDVDYKVTIRERERERERPREEDDFRFTERITTERDREPRRDISYRVVERESDYDHRSASGARSDYRAVDRESVVVPRAPSPPEERVREFRFERERDFSPPRRREQPYEVERYSKSTEYFAQPQPAPQQIIIRESAPQAPIIIREERRDPQPIIIRREEPHYEFIEREEVREDKQLVKREEPPTPAAPEPEPKKEEEDYFYERRVREVDRPRRREDSYDRRTEIRPRDSASNYSSDDSYEYVRRERTYETDRDHSPHHRRHLAEGALAGIAGAEIIRHHRKSEGRDAGGRVKSALGGAAVGAIGAEALSRARSRRRDSRSRSRSSSFEGRRDKRDRRKRRSRSRSRSKSMSRKQLGGLAAVAAVGALAGYALKKGGNKETVILNNDPPPRRSRSHRRRRSADSYPISPQDDKHRDPKHRNQRIAQAGLASAAAAGIWERVRSKSRGAKGRHRSKSRLHTGVPIAAAGLSGAALAGLYEKNKASKEAKRDAIIEDEKNRGRRRRSRSRSRSAPPSEYTDGRGHPDDRGLIAYGDEPIYPDQARSYYSDEEPGMYRRRHRGGSSGGSSPDTRRRHSSRSRSRGRNLEEMGAAAGLGGLAAHEYSKRNERKRSKSRQRHEEEMYNDQYRDGNSAGPYPPSPQAYLPQQDQRYGQQPPYGQQQQYPQSPFFPPPPTGEHAFAPQAEPYPPQNDPYPPQQQQASYPVYNPADYAQGHGATQQNPPYGGASRDMHGGGDVSPNASYGGGGGGGSGEAYPGDTHGHGHDEPSAPNTPGVHDDGRRGRNPENVSAPSGSSTSERHGGAASPNADGVESDPVTPTPRSSSRVRFDLGANEEHSPEARRKSHRTEERTSDSEGKDGRKHRHRDSHSRRDKGKGHHRDRDRDRDGARDSSQLMNDKYDRAPSESTARSRGGDDEGESDSTVDLPDRFDEQGNPKKEDFGTKLQDLLLGHSGHGGLLNTLLGSGDDQGGGDRDRDGGRSGRRKHRH